jgi:hypothetical protein
LAPNSPPMNIPLTISDSALPAWERRLKQFNDGSGTPVLSLVEFLQSQLDEETVRHVAAHESALRALMTTTADKLIAATGGDMTKLAEAVQAGEAAALATLSV